MKTPIRRSTTILFIAVIIYSSSAISLPFVNNSTLYSTLLKARTRATGTNGVSPGLSFDICFNTDDCSPEYLCIKVKNGTEHLCQSSSDCVCRYILIRECESCEDCLFPDRETCYVSNPNDRPGRCISLNRMYQHPDSFLEIGDCGLFVKPTDTPVPSMGFGITPIPSSNIEEVSSDSCIDASVLNKFGMRKVFGNDRRASVLCDFNGSCATHNHMVDWNGKTMSMKSYCQHFSTCDKRVIFVNSPRFQRAFRVQSKTIGLLYTAFAARYGSRFEEYILSTVLRLGI